MYKHAKQYLKKNGKPVRVGANNHNQIDGKMVYDCGGAYEVVGQTLQE